MQRLSLGSPAGKNSRLSVAADEEAEATDEKAAKAMVRARALNRSIHLVPVLTLLCFLVLFLLSHDPSAALTDSPVLAAATTVTVTARPLEAAVVAGGADATVASSGVYRRLKEDPRQQQQQQPHGRRLGMSRRR
ncbi:uncharacterized protein [Zea mays]|uniref:Uncharacterized protein n=1 Tax=Zea mays TaxID=4577 RepID=A0A1D6LF28_MAIZE|nr:uncharacterized protein LOC103629128 [Zea mays]AQK78547.1 hypothetical protein ZEAMMB73_Zm00001d035225 [Zea mays]|eukprot:XP_008648542.1 uncharacterized protein LOC103629128 [Zea mays]